MQWRVVQYGALKSELRMIARLDFIQRRIQQFGIDVQHAPLASLPADRVAIVHFTGIDADDAAGTGFNRLPVAQRAMAAEVDDADAVLIVSMARKRPRRSGHHDLHPGNRRRAVPELSVSHIPDLACWRRPAQHYPRMAIKFEFVTPILRIFDIPKADEFYLAFLGFSVDWEHRFDDNTPLYRCISRGGLILHLSEHHGDSAPGTHVRVTMSGVEEYQRELAAKHYRYMKPGLKTMPWGIETTVYDPFGNRITFCEPSAKA
jgi:hypothetical protein